MTQLEICDGKVSFPRLAARAHIGLPYETNIETLDIEAPSGPTVQGALKKMWAVTLRFYKSRAPFIGPNFEDMVEMKQREDENMGEPTQMLTGDIRTNTPASWNSHGRVAIRLLDPIPLTILAIIPELEAQDD